jgi:hypothetical protein
VYNIVPRSVPSFVGELGKIGFQTIDEKRGRARRRIPSETPRQQPAKKRLSRAPPTERDDFPYVVRLPDR